MKKSFISYSNLKYFTTRNNLNILQSKYNCNHNSSRKFITAAHYNYSSSTMSGKMIKFKINEDFIDLYRHREANFGFNGLGELVYRRTYSRQKEDGTNEQWWETVRRVVEGTFNLLLSHLDQNSIKVDEDTLQKLKNDSNIMFDKIFNFKFLPPGRGLWSMGTNITETKKIFAALNNCAFVSTRPTDRDNIEEIIKPYLFLMDNAMLGVGVGFDTKASELGIKLYQVNKIEANDSNYSNNIYYVQDSREGWVESVGVILRSYLQENMTLPHFDYSQVRPAGVPLKIFGGISSGPGPLKELHVNLTKILDNNAGKVLDSRIIVDIMNLIGKSVVSGNISNFIVYNKFHRKNCRNCTRRST
jgi:ribonucleoside-triphosphate reductase